MVIIPATRQSRGPIRKVVDATAEEQGTNWVRTERLSCGHNGEVLFRSIQFLGQSFIPTPAKQRRCEECRKIEARRAADAMLVELQGEVSEDRARDMMFLTYDMRVRRACADKYPSLVKYLNVVY